MKTGVQVHYSQKAAIPKKYIFLSSVVYLLFDMKKQFYHFSAFWLEIDFKISYTFFAKTVQNVLK